jgi:hypothetical protein
VQKDFLPYTADFNRISSGLVSAVMGKLSTL